MPSLGTYYTSPYNGELVQIYLPNTGLTGNDAAVNQNFATLADGLSAIYGNGGLYSSTGVLTVHNAGFFQPATLNLGSGAIGYSTITDDGGGDLTVNPGTASGNLKLGTTTTGTITIGDASGLGGTLVLNSPTINFGILATVNYNASVLVMAGAKIGNSPTDTMGFYGASAVAQQSSSGVTTVAGVLSILRAYGLCT